MGTGALILFFITGFFMVGAGMVASSIFSPSSKNDAKGEAYECGIPTEGPSWFRFKSGYYLFALLFLIFDVEIVFLVPWAVVMKSIGLRAFIEIIIFIFILGLGLLYAWKKNALKWE